MRKLRIDKDHRGYVWHVDRLGAQRASLLFQSEHGATSDLSADLMRSQRDIFVEDWPGRAR